MNGLGSSLPFIHYTKCNIADSWVVSIPAIVSWHNWTPPLSKLNSLYHPSLAAPFKLHKQVTSQICAELKNGIKMDRVLDHVSIGYACCMLALQPKSSIYWLTYECEWMVDCSEVRVTTRYLCELSIDFTVVFRLWTNFFQTPISPSKLCRYQQ